MNADERLKIAHWILERNLNWISATEAKTAFIVAVDTGMLGALASAFGGATSDARSAMVIFTFTLATFLLGCSVVCVAMTVLPRMSGPATSFIFFGRIAERNVANYTHEFRNADADALLDDCLAQIHRNAEIALAKYQWVSAAMRWSFAALIPWVTALGALLQK
jgi:hypothetical protein